MINEYYVAGLFDGEGWFQIRRAKASLYRGTREWSYQGSTHIVMREKHILEAIQERFGGKVTNVKNRSENHSPYFEWRLGGVASAEFAQEISDKLIAKRKQAELIAAFQAEKNANGNQPLPDSRYEFYGQCYAQMKVLNAKGVGKPE